MTTILKIGHDKVKVKVKCTLVQAVRFCAGRTPHRGVEVYLYSFFTTALEGVRGQRHAQAALYPQETPGTHCTGGWVGPMAGLDRCGKTRPHRDSIPGPFSPYPVAIPTELSRPTKIGHDKVIIQKAVCFISFCGNTVPKSRVRLGP